MSSITITNKIWINLASDPSQRWWFTFITSIGSNPALNATTDTDALGNQGAVVTPGNALTYPVQFVACDAPRRWALETYLPGQAVWVRDPLSRKFGAIFWAPQIVEHEYNDECDIAVTFTKLDLVEGP